MNITQLEAFVAVVERGSFSAAARSLGLSQPAVTMQIQQLEADLGVALLIRGPRTSTPTEAGQALLGPAREVLAELRSVRLEVQRMADRVAGGLVIAASTTPGQYVLPRLVGSFLDRYPDVTISLTVSDSADVVRAVAEGEAAMGMTGAHIKGSPVDFEAAGSDDIVLVVPPRAAVKDLRSARFIVREPGSGTRAAAESALSKAGVDRRAMNVVLELGTNEAIVNAVEGGLGVGAVSSRAAEKALVLGTVKTVEATGFPAHRPLYLVTPRGPLPRTVEAFIEHVRETLGN